MCEHPFQVEEEQLNIGLIIDVDEFELEIPPVVIVALDHGHHPCFELNFGAVTALSTRLSHCKSTTPSTAQ